MTTARRTKLRRTNTWWTTAVTRTSRSYHPQNAIARPHVGQHCRGTTTSRPAAIRDCAVVGLPDADYGERVVAAVMLEKPGATDEHELIAYVRKRIAGFKTPRQVFFVDEFPRTPAGKIQKHLVRQSLLSVVS